MGSIGSSAKAYTVEYEPRTRGQITRYEAGVLYRAVKNGQVNVRPELTRDLYDQANDLVRFAGQRYNQDYLYYDRVENMTRALLNNDYEAAQNYIDQIEENNIKRAGKKSKWYKYLV